LSGDLTGGARVRVQQHTKQRKFTLSKCFSLQPIQPMHTTTSRRELEQPGDSKGGISAAETNLSPSIRDTDNLCACACCAAACECELRLRRARGTAARVASQLDAEKQWHRRNASITRYPGGTIHSC
jgi:hypothetical protein